MNPIVRYSIHEIQLAAMSYLKQLLQVIFLLL